MKIKKLLPSLVLIVLHVACFSWEAKAQIWNEHQSIGNHSRKYHFAYNQVPDPLVELQPAGFPNTGFSYEWEQSPYPTTGFTLVSGGATLTFTGPLGQTTYFRRKTIKNSNGEFKYSNTVKIEVVSQQWEDRTYVREHSVTKAGVTSWQAVDALPIGDKFQTTTYLDGLGRRLQSVSRETASPTEGSTLWGDVVQFSRYDAYGREPEQYLPYTTTTEGGKFKTGAPTEQAQYYAAQYSETAPFRFIQFEESPLQRVTTVRQPGTSWAASPGNRASYELNSASDNVQHFTVAYGTNLAPLHKGAYGANTLYKTVTTDESGKRVVEYTNTAGQLILRKVQLDDVPSAAHSGWICTYSIYDDFGQLRYQLQPEAVRYLDQNSWSFAGTDGQKVLEELCFQYYYDEKGRTTWKRAPGAQALQMIYDGRDRVVFTQDGNQRLQSPSEWTATLYDELDRPVVTTLYRTPKTAADLKNDLALSVSTTTVSVGNPGQPVNDLVVSHREAGVARYAAQNSIEFVSAGGQSFETVAGDNFVAEIDPATTAGYTVTATTYNNPIIAADLNNPSVNTVVKYQFYDNYSYKGVKTFDPAVENTVAYSNGEPGVLSITPTARTLNFPTGSMVRVLGTSSFLVSTVFYDEEGNPIQTVEDNLKSGRDVTTLQYHFDGRLLSTHTKHSTAGTGYSGFSVLTKNVFDRIGRVTGVEKKLGANPFKAVATYSFDELGRLKTKRLAPGYTATGKNELESLSYSYNIHNNITGINKDYALKNGGSYDKWGHFFGLYLGYDNRDGLFSKAALNGQVTGLLWNTQGDDAQRKYDFTYDPAGRLTAAQFTERATPTDGWSSARMDFSVTGAGGKIGYDLNGNLLSLWHKGILPGGQVPVSVDELQYSYALLSNRLLKVTDQTTVGNANGKQGDFKDGSNGAQDDYVYDANGNLVIDLNKNVKELAGVVGAGGIRYNFLDKPEEIRLVGKGTIKIVYDAEGNKLQRSYTPEGGGATTTTSYINGFVYSGDALQYIHFEEGRIRVMQPVAQNNGYDGLLLDGNLSLPGGKEGAWDYFVRDYQENVRMILTEEVHEGLNQCTMETARSGQEEPFFGQSGAGNEVVQTRFAVSSIPGQGSGGGWQHPAIGGQVSRLGNLYGKKSGPNALLKVMAGDKVSATTQYYYQNPVSNGTGTNLINDVVNSLVQAIGGSPVTGLVTKEATGTISTQLDGSLPFRSAVAPDEHNGAGTNPKAYLTVLFFDERFQFVEEGSTSLRVSEAGSANASLTLANLKAPKNGYAFVYLSNESDEAVYFDNLKVGHNRGRIVEENHYYAYGLRIAAISSKKLGDPNEGSLQNSYLYNDKELIEEGDLGWYDYGFRNYDPQIGRFPQLDPLTDKYPFLTPYQYASNDPITNIDIDGLEGGSAVNAFSYSYTPASFMSYMPKTVAQTGSLGAKAGTAITAVKSAGLAAGTAGAASAGRSSLRVAVKNGMDQGAKVVKMTANKSTGFLKNVLPWAGRFGGVVFGVLTPLDAGPEAPGGNELYYYPGHPGYNGPKFSPAPNPKPEINPKGGGDDGGDESLASVRFQVQTGKLNVSQDVKTNKKSVGVTKRQGYDALKTIYDDAIMEDPSLANNKNFRRAIIKMSQKIKAISKGLTKGPYQTTLQELFQHNGKQYRIDLEVQRGVNFKY